MSHRVLPVPRNLERFPELHPPLDCQSALAEANRCLFCFDAPCTGACPTHIDVPRFIRKISTGNLRGSALTILDANILGLSCSRVCPVDVLCEGACVLQRYNQKPIEIGRLQRYAMDWFYERGAPIAARAAPPVTTPPTAAPVTTPPAAAPPATALPVTAPPVTAPPAGAPTATEPAAAPPVTAAPPTAPPATAPPVTAPPVAATPATPSPVTAPPVTAPSVTEPRPTGSGIACIGGGPAALACAAELRRHGYPVAIFDNRPLPGGLNTYGVAEYKLRPSDALREVAMVRGMGVEFRQATVGRDVRLEDLEKQFCFIFLAMGLGSMERLGIPGENLTGVIDALRFIERYKTSGDFEIGRTVVVIGGGNTAIDAANAARRLGAEQVHLFYRRTEREMPAFRFEFDRSKVEGVRFHWLAQPVEILGCDGRVTSVRFAGMQFAEPDLSGRRTVVPAPGAAFEFACDMVIPALGQARLTELLHETRGIETRGGIVVVDRPTGQTANPQYYAGGDCVNGGREVVDAVADGKRAALAMVRRLEALRG